MTTSPQEPLPNPLKIKPLFSKSLHTSDTTFLAKTNKRQEKLRSLWIQEELWKVIYDERKTRNSLKKVINGSKALRKFKLDPVESEEEDHLRKKDIERALVEILESFKNHSVLVNIDFFFGEMEGMENTLRIVTKSVGHVLWRVKDFSYGTRYWYYIGRGNNAILTNKGLKRLPFLQGMTLRVPALLDNVNALAEWEKNLFECKALKKLSLDLQGSHETSDRSVKRIQEVLQRLSCLENLRINLIMWKPLNIESLEKLIKGISELRLLEGLYLSFPDCQLFTNDWMRILCENFAKRSTIKRLELNFDQCKKIKNKAFEFLCKCLQQLQKLTWIKLDFSR